ncbi:TPA: hypothetical protein MNP03_002186 [Klebsiella pneumoniae]|nr:hypothetical protein [Klebsiella pneumoniae]HBW4825641.1 hypothetical protein [Klebsiella pneumoniae]HBW4847813.1 hypothetical protein [Klebsiella pneumoniae]HBW4869325.1 hypothetical protein [Klebsiella pneumoniae]HBW5002553.1 hypothetical protein [Klebsiella pneumoniae]
MKAFTPVEARKFVASTWYETTFLSKREKLYAKALELISGDRAEIICQTNNPEYRKSAREWWKYDHG